MSLRFQRLGEEISPSETTAERFLVGSLPDAGGSARDRVISPWRPRHPEDLLCGHSATEIALNLILLEGPPSRGAVEGERLSIDNLCACFCLLQPAIASRHREILLQVAEMGLFQAWGTRTAMNVYQRLQDLLRHARNCRQAEHETFLSCFRHLPGILASDPQSLDPRPEEHAELLLEQGPIDRELFHRRFTSYRIPRRLHRGVYYKALRISPVDAPLDDPSLLSCRVRNRLDGDRVQLVSVEAAEGWYHDLLYPSWMVADSPGRSRAPGLVAAPRAGAWRLDYPELVQVISRLGERERNTGRWTLRPEIHPLERSTGRAFPVVLYYEDGRGNPAPSSLPPHELADRLCRLFSPDRWGD